MASTTDDTRPQGGPAAAAKDIAGRFQIVKFLGTGRMGRVYHVRDRQAENRELALKILKDSYGYMSEFKEGFFATIEAAQKLDSPRINDVRHAGVTDSGELFFAMERVSGETLRQRLERENNLQAAHAVEIARQMLAGLHVSHEARLVHGDVRPEKVMLASGVTKSESNPFGVDVSLREFGIASLAVQAGKPGSSHAYMAPEQVRGEMPDVRSDLYAVGVVLLEMLSGSVAFKSEIGKPLLAAGTAGDEKQVEGLLERVDAPVRKVLSKALALKPDARFQTAPAFMKAFEACAVARAKATGMPGWAKAVVILLVGGMAASGYLMLSADERLQRLKDQITGLETARGEAEIQVASLTADTVRLEQNLDRSRQDLDSEQARVLERDQAMAGLNLQLESLQGDLAARDERITELESRHELDKWEQQRLEGHVADLEGQLEARLAELTAATAAGKAVASASSPANAAAGGTASAPPANPALLWEAVVADGPDQDPTRAFELVEAAAGGLDAELETFASAYLDAVIARVAPEGRLLEQALRAEDHLFVWSDRLTALAATEAWPVARQIHLLRHAQRFFGGAVDKPFDWSRITIPVGTGDGTADWRRAFQLRTRVVLGRRWPLATPQRAVYVRRGPDGVAYYRDEAASSSKPEAPVVARSVFVPGAKAGQVEWVDDLQIQYASSGDNRFAWNGLTIDLVHDATRIQRFESTESTLPIPPMAGIVEADVGTYRKFVAELPAHERDCLVFTHGDTTSWLSPTLGLVRQVTRSPAGDTVLELAYSTVRSIR